MSNIFNKDLPVDFTIAIDPGYATQGISVWDNRGQVPAPIMSKSTITDSSTDVWERVAWQFQRVRDVLRWLGQSGNVPLNCVLILEEYRVSGGQNTSPGVIYNRAIYDALFRERMARLFRFSFTIHPLIVQAFSGLKVQKQMPIKTGKKKGQMQTRSVPHPEYDGSIDGIFRYLKTIWPDLLHPSVLTVESEFHQVEWLGKSPPKRTAKNSWVSHAMDAMVMALIGMSTFIYKGMAERWNDKQRGKIKELQEVYPFDEEANRTFR